MPPLVEPGNPKAPVGSRPWCLYLYDTAMRFMKEGTFAVQELKMKLLAFRDKQYYQRLTDDKDRPFQTWEHFVQFREPFGLGLPLEVAEAILREQNGKRLIGEVVQEARELAKHGEIGNGRSRGVATPLTRGTGNAAYLTARIKRDAPEIAARLHDFDSVAEAARAAGIPQTVRITLGDPQKLAQRIADKGPDYARAVAEALDALLLKPSDRR